MNPHQTICSTISQVCTVFLLNLRVVNVLVSVSVSASGPLVHRLQEESLHSTSRLVCRSRRPPFEPNECGTPAFFGEGHRASNFSLSQLFKLFFAATRRRSFGVGGHSSCQLCMVVVAITGGGCGLDFSALSEMTANVETTSEVQHRTSSGKCGLPQMFSWCRAVSWQSPTAWVLERVCVGK